LTLCPSCLLCETSWNSCISYFHQAHKPPTKSAFSLLLPTRQKSPHQKNLYSLRVPLCLLCGPPCNPLFSPKKTNQHLTTRTRTKNFYLQISPSIKLSFPTRKNTLYHNGFFLYVIQEKHPFLQNPLFFFHFQ